MKAAHLIHPAVAVMFAAPALSNTYIVTNINDAGAGSLRQAIINANANPGTDFIEFSIPGTGPHTIFPTSPLPIISGTVSIDGTTEPDFAGTPVIELAGDSAGAGANGLYILNNSSQVRGLVINGWGGDGIRVEGTGNASIVGCYIGVNQSGLAANFPNGGDGIEIRDSPNNDIGGTVASLRNIIGGNRQYGVHINGASATDNVVAGNYIGTDRNGASALHNGPVQTGTCGAGGGVGVVGAPNNTIGGTTTGARNLISGNWCDNIVCISADGTIIRGNYIGTNASGTAEIIYPDPDDDTSRNIVIFSQNILVGGTVAGSRNVIGGTNTGVAIFDDNNTVQGNYIGINPAGTAAVPCGAGVLIHTGSHNLVGGDVSAARNVISGCAQGVEVLACCSGGGPQPAEFNEIKGNYIGTNAAGTAAIPNGTGIRLGRSSAGYDVRFNTIGGASFFARNYISGNTDDGIVLGDFFGGTDVVWGNTIINNAIGIAPADGSPLGNGGNGITVKNESFSNTIGSTLAGGINIIGYNGGSGIAIVSGVGNNLILNKILGNGGLGIDLGDDGVTPNDPDDTDASPNRFQNFPENITAETTGTTTTVNAFLDSAPSRTYRIDVFSNPICDPSGNGEGVFPLGSFNVVTSAAGTVQFSDVVVHAGFPAEYWYGIAMTATDLTTGDTSEFSGCVELSAAACGPGAGSCYDNGGNGSAGCESGDCCDVVCDIDPYCCDATWDDICADLARQTCADCGTIAAGDPYEANGSPGCWDDDCCEAICTIDPYCCDVTWDNICADAALKACTPCPGDVPLNSPGVVDVSDLLALLAAWGSTGVNQPADIAPSPAGDGVVNVSDLLLLLASWGACP